MVKRLSNTDQNNNQLTNVPTPTNDGDAANKAYADTKVQGPSSTAGGRIPIYGSSTGKELVQDSSFYLDAQTQLNVKGVNIYQDDPSNEGDGTSYFYVRDKSGNDIVRFQDGPDGYGFLVNMTLVSPKATQINYPIYDRGTITTNQVFAFSNRYEKATLGANVSISNSFSGSYGDQMYMHLYYDGVAQRTITWDSDIAWLAATAPTTPSTNDQVLVVRLDRIGEETSLGDSTFIGTWWLVNTSTKVIVSTNSVGSGGGGLNWVPVTVATAAGTAAKTGTTTGGSYTPSVGDILRVTFSNGVNVNNPTLAIDGGSAINIRLGNVNVSTSIIGTTSSVILPLWYDGTYYQMFGSTKNDNTTYAEITEAEITTGTASTARAISGRRAKFIQDTTKAVFVQTDAPTDTNKLWYDSDETSQSVAANADTVDTYHASATPTPNTLLPLDTNARIPYAAIPAPKLGIIPNTLFATTGNKSITGIGFKPKIVRITLLGDSPTMIRSGYGAMSADGSQYAVISQVNNGNLANSGTWSSQTNVVLVYNASASAPLIAASYVSMDADGFTINVTTANDAFSYAYEAEP